MDRERTSSLRDLAARLLRVLARYAPEERRDWAEAMLRELDYAGRDSKWGEWGALFWALGCATAIFREGLRGWGAWVRRHVADFIGVQTSQEGKRMNSTGKKTLGVLAGMGIALGLGVSAFLLRNVMADLLRTVGIPPSMWSHIVSVILPTELLVVAAAIVLWRRRRAPVAIGLLLPAVVMWAHVVVFLVHR